jgi:hypothetical protein
MIGQVTGPKCLNVDWLLAAFAKRKADAVKRYKIFVSEGNAAYLSTISALPSLRGTTQSFTEWRYAEKDRRATARDDVVLLLFLRK